MTTLITFSPTGGTATIAECVARGMTEEPFEHIDLTPAGTVDAAPRIVAGDTAVIAVPVHYGRVPEEAAARLRRIRGLQTPAVLVVVYGNRAYEDALLELRDIVEAIGFEPVAAGAFIAEHSFSCPATPLAAGRPDSSDLERAVAFGKMVRGKMSGLGEGAEPRPLEIPGNSPYRGRPDRSPTTPRSDAEICDLCGRCAEVCPTDAITVAETVTTDQDACMLCCACVRECPNHGRILDGEWAEEITAKLASLCTERREPELIL